MIQFKFQIEYPWLASVSSTSNWFFRDWKLSKNKNLEFQIGHWDKLHSLIDADISTYWSGRDHAGPSFELTILWFFVNIRMYDNRHWNYDEGTWEVYDEK